MDRKTYLRDLMARHDLTPGDVARLLSVHPTTVYSWRTPNHPQSIPCHKLELLELKLRSRRVSA